MNKGNSNHYSLLLQDETETDGIGLEEEEEEEEAEADMNGMEEEDDEEDDDEEPMEDSDEEEIFSSSKHRALSHEGANLNGQNHLGGHGNEYRLLNNNDADLKAVIDTPITIWTPTPMSPARRACFIASIMFGVLMVATFLWVLPCDVQPCEGEIGLTDRFWAVKIEGMGINLTKLVRRLSGGHNVLLSYYTSNNISGWQTENSTATEQLVTGCNNCGDGDDGESSYNDIIGDGQCGLLMLDGNLGRENWRIPLRECPVDLQCDLLDVSGDRVPDCIVRGGHSMVFMIEARYGTIMWHLHQHKVFEEKSLLDSGAIHSTRPPARLLNPGSAILLPDVNNDSFGDLLFTGLLSSQSQLPWNMDYTDSDLFPSKSEGPDSRNLQTPVNNLVLVCGQSGSVLGTPFILKTCQKNLSLTSDGQSISYSCLSIDGKKGPMSGRISIPQLLNQILGSSAPVRESLESFHTNSHTAHARPCKIMVYKERNCNLPKCKSSVNLSRSDNHVLLRREYEHSGVVSWAALLSNGECHGAILKIWEYKQITTVVKTAKPPSNINRRTTRSSLLNDDVETEPTHIEKDGNDLQFTIVMNSNNSGTNQIDTLLHKSNIAGRNEEYSNQDKEPYVNTQSTTTDSESSRLRREFHRDSGEAIDAHDNGEPIDVYEHPTIHQHQGKQASGIHEEQNQPLEEYSGNVERDSDVWQTPESHPYHPKQIQTTASIPRSFPTGMRTMPPDVLAPPGYQLQHIHERIVIFKFNGTEWYEETLTSLGVRQLCRSQNKCIPDMKSHCKSVAVSPGAGERTWQVVTTSTTFVSNPTSGEEQHTAPWTLTSIVRKMIVSV